MHHAQLLIGSYAWAGSILPEVLRSEGEDVRHYRGVRMGIDEVRTIIYEAYLKPIHEDKRSFIIAYSGLTLQAQNALLKLLEDPPVTARFFIIIDREELLIPTVRSRLLIVAREDVQAVDAECLKFFTLGVTDRLTLIASRMKNKDDVWAREMMRAIEEKAHREKNIPVLKTLDELRPFYDTQGASRKMVLEHLALMF